MNFSNYWNENEIDLICCVSKKEVAEKAFTQGILETKLNISAVLNCAKIQRDCKVLTTGKILDILIKDLEQIIDMGNIN